MKLAVCLYKYFPFGGLARDFLRIMTICRQRGYDIDVYVMEWQGDIPEGFNVHIIPLQGWSNHRKVASFVQQIQAKLEHGNYDLIVGFNKIPGLDLYYAADPCYIDRVKNQKDYFLQQYLGRVRFYSKGEASVFSEQSATVALMISDIQMALFKKHYHTPDNRLLMLPPGISADRKRPDNWQQIRHDFRDEFSIADDDFIVLMVGTGFKTKGLDRGIEALASLPAAALNKAHLFVVGDGDTAPYQKRADKLSIAEHVHFFGGRTDVPRFLLGADVLIHPARKENTGTVILEAIVAGLPVLVTEVCGYAKHVTKSQTGGVSNSPFKQVDFNTQLMSMLDKNYLQTRSVNGLSYAESEDLYSMPTQVADIIDEMTHAKIEP